MTVEVTWNGVAIAAKVRAAQFQALKSGGELILSDSLEQCPVAEVNGGTLRRSGNVKSDAAAGIVIISFNTPYAVAQHERMDYHHTTGKSKYLEDPYNANRNDVLSRVAAAGKAVMR